MGRLKKDHSGWSTSGKWLKYQQPTIAEQPAKGKNKKKDTNKWCRGKVGVEHEWHTYNKKRYNWEVDDYVWPYKEIKCVVCRKEKLIKSANSASYPTQLWIDDKNEGYEPVQVRVNGKYLPINYLEYQKGKYWCKMCGVFHS